MFSRLFWVFWILLVYVVSVGGGSPDGWSISWRDIINKKRSYFHQREKAKMNSIVTDYKEYFEIDL